jgi:putative chitinase
MRVIQRKIFFDEFKDRFGGIRRDQVEPLDSLISFIERDPHVTIVSDAAYLLATAYHETAHTFRPVREYGGKARAERMYGYLTSLGKRLGNDAPGEGAAYMGAGFVQLTGETNFERAEAELRRQYPDVVARFEERTGKQFDLTVGDQADDEHDPDNAMDPEIAYAVLSAGTRQGWFGKRMTIYTHKTPPDYVGARRSVNGTDADTTIAAHARKFEAILKASLADAPMLGLVDEPAVAHNAALDVHGGEPPAAPPADTSTTVNAEPGSMVNVAAAPQAVQAAPVPVPGGGHTDPTVQVTAGKSSWVTQIIAWISALFATASGYVERAFGLSPEIQKWLLVGVAVLGAVFLICKAIAAWQVRAIHADPTKVNVS